MDLKVDCPSTTEVENWDVDAVAKWLVAQGFQSCTATFVDNAVDGFTLVRLSEDDLRREPMGLKKLGDIKRIIGAIDNLVPSKNRVCGTVCHHRLGKYTHSATSPSSNEDSPTVVDGFNHRKYSKHLKPEKFKTLVAAVYATIVFYFVALVMVIVNERVPDMETYPPLPDLFLDNLPFIPGAFNAAEYIALTLFCIFGFIILTHKHRFIILRRYFSLVGTLFLLRAICMLITSLSVPCQYFECHRYVDPDFVSKLKRAWDVMRAGGMALNGVRLCGDYMFSGHTTILTLVSLFIDEYSDKNYPIVKTLSWVLSVFGVFLVMAGHEHYSIDVFIAFYLTTRLFLYYHTLADNKAQLRYDETRVRIWFPLFSYFESGITGSVPHEYDWPLHLPDFISVRLFGEKRDKTE